MLSTLKSVWKIPDLKKKIIFTVLMFLVFRMGAHVPVPGINGEAVKELLATGTLFGFFDVISGGAFKNFTVFAMGIMPYINASIIMQLLTIVIPYFERLSKEGEEGRKKLTQFTRYGTVFLGAVQATGMSFFLTRQPGILLDPSWSSLAVIIISLTAGTAF